MFCAQCGTQSGECQKFCAACGAALAVIETPKPIAPQSLRDAAQSTAPPAAGNRLLRITGILFLIFGGLYALWSWTMLITIDMWLWLTRGNVLRSAWITYYAWSTVYGTIAILVGAYGVAWSARQEKAKMLFGAGVASILFVIFYYGISLSIGMWHSVSFAMMTWTLPLELALPVLLLVGAVKNRVRH